MSHKHNRMADIMQKIHGKRLVCKMPMQAIVAHLSIVLLSYNFDSSCSSIKHNLMTE